MTGTARVIRGNALDLAASGIADNSVDLIITSPPYFGLRSYQDGGQHYAGQVGDEATPAEFVNALIAATAEMKRVIKPAGSIWVNLGDKYVSRQAGWGQTDGGSWAKVHKHAGDTRRNGAEVPGRRGGAGMTRSGALAEESGIPVKSLMGIPWRYAIRCIDDLGLILRAEVVWSKPNGLPESVTDRVRRSHEQWFHFTKEPRYYTAIDEIREPHAPAGLARRATPYQVNDAQRASKNPVLNGEGFRPANPLGKLPGSVWSIPTQPLRAPKVIGLVGGHVVEAFYGRTHDEAWPLAWKWQREGTRHARRSVRPLTDHFAAFPMEWPRRIIRAWSPPGICTACGEGRRPITSAQTVEDRGGRWQGATAADERRTSNDRSGLGLVQTRTITGYTCACPDTTAPTTPATVLDPFGGTGTTALVAAAWGRHGISIDLSHDYCRLARWRTTDPKQLAKAGSLPAPKPAHAAAPELTVETADLLDLL